MGKTYRERLIDTLNHRDPDQVVVDLGSTSITGININALVKLRRGLGLEEITPVMDESLQLLGRVDEDLRQAVGAGVIGVNKTLTGRNIYAIGNNERTAQLSGINVKALKTLTYVITSTLCALCGVIVAGNLSSADATLGVGYETDTIAAVVIGGVAMSGGEGTIWGSLLGAAIIGILKNAFVLLRISAYWQSIVIGIVIIAAVTIDKVRTSSHKA